MADLRVLFEELGFANVATFIASGNVIFESDETTTALLEKQIERHLKQALSYEVATFIRTTAELAAVAAHQPFPASEPFPATHTLSVIFLSAVPHADVAPKLEAFATPTDLFHVNQREIYWLCHTRTSDSPVDWPKLSKALALPMTTRNVTTVRKLAAKYPN